MRPLVTLVVGARPNFMKAAALLPPLRAAGIRIRLVHTGQHYDPSMSGVFFRQLGLPRPDLHLGVRPGAGQAARILEGVERDLRARRPAALVVVGDVTSTMAAALSAARAGVPVVHVEAGPRSFDRRMAEEAHRTVVDHVASLLLTTAPEDDRNLRCEGISSARVRRIGDVMVDTLLKCRGRVRGPSAPARFGLVTLHRPENVDRPRRLGALLKALWALSRDLPLLFPVHPRTRRRMRGMRLPPGIRLLPPQGYLEFLGLLERSALVLTDSGGLQLEASVLGVPCLTLRSVTERRLTCRLGTNRLAGEDPAAVPALAARLLKRPPRPRAIPLWDGRSGERAARAILARLRRTGYTG